jgi:hypothetical protein
VLSVATALAEQCRLAYIEARRLVFDRFPDGGVPPREELDDAQRRALDRLEEAEAAQQHYRRQNAQKSRS